MPDIFEGDTPESDFDLPGDDQVMERLVENSPDPEVQEFAAEQAAEPAEEATESPLDARIRDEKGRFASAEAEEPAEDAESGEEPPLDARLAEKEAMIGRQSTEIGELRAWREQAQAYFEQQQAAQQAPQPPADWDDLIDQNPAYAAQLANANGDQYNLQRAMQEWESVSPGAPGLWVQQEHLAQQQQQILHQQASSQGQQRQAETGQKVAELADKYPDLPSLVEQMSEIAPQYPHEMWALASGHPEVVSKAVESLYLKARGLHADTLVARGQVNAQKLAQDEARVAQEAQVVSGSRTNREPAPSLAEAIAADWPSDDRLKSGWNI